jgi:hypothetical protein
MPDRNEIQSELEKCLSRHIKYVKKEIVKTPEGQVSVYVYDVGDSLLFMLHAYGRRTGDGHIGHTLTSSSSAAAAVRNYAEREAFS